MADIIPSTALNRLRAAAGLLPQIMAGLADGKITVEKAALSAEFCLWALDGADQAGPEGSDCAKSLRQGLETLSGMLERQGN